MNNNVAKLISINGDDDFFVSTIMPNGIVLQHVIKKAAAALYKKYCK